MPIVHVNLRMLERRITLGEMAAKDQARSYRRIAEFTAKRNGRRIMDAGADTLLVGTALVEWQERLE